MPSLGTRPPLVRVADGRLRSTVMVCTFAILGGFVALVWLMCRSDWSQPLVWLWASLGWIATIGSFRYLAQLYRWEAATVSFGPDSMRVVRRGRMEAEIEYSEISGYRFDPKAPDRWLTVEGAEGEPLLTVANHSLFSGVAQDSKEIVRGLGPNLVSSATQDRGVTPPDPYERYLYDHFWQPPAISIVPGVRYRYRFPSELKSKLDPFSALGPVGVLITLLPNLSKGSERASPFFLATVAILSGLSLFCFRYFFRMAYLRYSLENEFEIVPEGLRVTRDGRTWVVPGPATQERGLWTARLDGRPLLRFGGGTKIQYLDPTMLERVS